MSLDPPRRSSPPPAVWIVLGFVVLGLVLSAALGALAWQKARKVRDLQEQVLVLQAERQSLEGRLNSLQLTAEGMEQRVAALEANDPSKQIALLQAAVDAATGPGQAADLKAQLDQVQSRVDVFQGSLAELQDRVSSLSDAPADGGLPATARIQVARQRQSHNLSCESSAASMAAGYFGLSLGEAQVLAELPRSENPHLGFRGNPDGPTGGIVDYGVYAGPIMDVLKAHGLRAWAVEGGVAGLRAAIARGNPVIAWMTYDMMVSQPVVQTIAGQDVTLVPNQHVVVVTGYDGAGFWANDPWDGAEDYYATADMVRSMGYFGDMAVEVAAP